MKHWNIELHKLKGITNSQGVIRAQIDALVQPVAARDEAAATGTVLSFSEDTARVLVLLLKAQLAEFDARKARSRR